MLGIFNRLSNRKYCKMACESKRVGDKGKIVKMGDFNYLEVNWYEYEVRL